MAYSMKKMPNEQLEFPAPPLWLLWTADYKDPSVGQVRHHPSLQKCKAAVYRRPFDGGGDRTFWRDWAIYEWTGEEYELRYSGKDGEPSVNHPLFKERVRADGKGREPSQAAVDAALESILGAMA